MEINKNESKDYTVIVFIGDLDKAGLDIIREQLDKTVEELTTSRMIFDFSKLNFINSEGIGFLLKVHYRLIKRNKKLVIVNAADHVKDVLDVIGLLKILDYYPTLNEFESNL